MALVPKRESVDVSMPSGRSWCIPPLLIRYPDIQDRHPCLCVPDQSLQIGRHKPYPNDTGDRACLLDPYGDTRCTGLLHGDSATGSGCELRDPPVPNCPHAAWSLLRSGCHWSVFAGIRFFSWPNWIVVRIQVKRHVVFPFRRFFF